MIGAADIAQDMYDEIENLTAEIEQLKRGTRRDRKDISMQVKRIETLLAEGSALRDALKIIANPERPDSINAREIAKQALARVQVGQDSAVSGRQGPSDG